MYVSILMRTNMIISVLYRRTQWTAFNKADNCQWFITQRLLWGHTLIANWQALMSMELWLFFIISITITFHKWLMVQILFDFNDILSISQMGLCLCVSDLQSFHSFHIAIQILLHHGSSLYTFPNTKSTSILLSKHYF